ncbi:MAG TPA: glycine cleavage system protein GcvH [Sphingobacteriaceae bacterium]|nr:glycine cleavage system protein GcvH [Sphingobacteriaceae bacterium]
MNFPEELKYTKDHEWIRVEGEEAVIGITSFAQSELGDIVFVDVDTIGDEVGQDDVFGSVEAVKTVSDLFSPVTCTILEVNGEIDGSPELINQDPYGKGWIIRVKLSEPAQVENLLSAQEYKDLVSA